MLKKCCICYLLLLLLCSGSCFLFTACDDEETEWTRPVELNDIDSYIKEGILLKNYQEGNKQYTFTFEDQTTINLPAETIKNIQENPDQWVTIVTLSNDQEYKIPTQGTSIESFIKDIKVNPSGYCPLAASIHMQLPAKGRLGVKVLSKEGANTPDQEHLYQFSDNYEQNVTVLGLYENHKNQIELVYTDKKGNERGKTQLEIPTQPLNIKRLLNHKVVTCQIDRMEPGLTFVAGRGEGDTDTSIPYMVDADGEIRWVLEWSNHPKLNHWGGQCGLMRMKDGNYLGGDINNKQLVIVNVLGELQKSLNLEDLGFSFHHELKVTADQKVLIAVTKNDAKIADNSNARIFDFVAKLNPESGTVISLWDLTTMLDSSRITFAKRPDVYDELPKVDVQSRTNWCHNNGVEEMRDGSILCTGRWQGIFKYTHAGELKWIIAPHNEWKQEYHKYLLTPLDRNGNPITDPDVLNGKKAHPDFDWGWGSHSPIETPDGNIMVFDNGYVRHYNFDNPEKYSRAVEYKIDEQNMTIRQVWEYGRERGRDCFSVIVSSVQYLKQTGNRFFAPGFGNPIRWGSKYGGHLIEIDPRTGEVVFEIEVQSDNSVGFHRAVRLPLYPEGL